MPTKEIPAVPPTLTPTLQKLYTEKEQVQVLLLGVIIGVVAVALAVALVALTSPASIDLTGWHCTHWHIAYQAQQVVSTCVQETKN